jgi:hypothetical protein
MKKNIRREPAAATPVKLVAIRTGVRAGLKR